MKISRAIMVVSILWVAVFAQGHAALADALKIGVISAKSGVFAIFGASGEKGAILAADEINADGGILGQKIDLVLGDDKSKPEEASRIFREMVAGGAVVILGVIGTGETQAVSTLAREDKVPFFTGLGYRSFLTEESRTSLFLSSDIQQPRHIMDLWSTVYFRRVTHRYCTINNDFAFSRDLNESVLGDLKGKIQKST